MHIGMVGPANLLSSKHRQISQQDSNIVMIHMDHHNTSPPPHSMIPNASILPHPVFSVTPSSFTHFTPSLPHQPRAIP
jgi:hypothetical protein